MRDSVTVAKVFPLSEHQDALLFSAGLCLKRSRLRLAPAGYQLLFLKVKGPEWKKQSVKSQTGFFLVELLKTG